MSFEDLKKANETIISMDVKGKPYALVNERIKAFRMLYPEGFITTEILSLQDGVVVMKATAGYYNEDGSKHILATGTAYEKENSTFINKTSYIENAETSCIGRCMGIIGLGIDTSIASAEEVQNAINNQGDRLTLMARIKELVIETETDYDELLKHYKVKSDSEMSVAQLQEAVAILERKLK